MSADFTFAYVFCSVPFKGWNEHIYLKVFLLRIAKTWKYSSKKEKDEVWLWEAALVPEPNLQKSRSLRTFISRVWLGQMHF